MPASTLFLWLLKRVGSVDVRFKLWEEGISLVTQYPLTGVGLNRSREEYISSPTTDYFQRFSPVRFTGIHNTFLEIAAEAGIPGFILFTLFLIFIFKHYFHLQNKSKFKKAAFYGLLGLIGMSMFNPFFYSSRNCASFSSVGHYFSLK